ncbi:DUF6479 family protein [Streptomyces sp. M41(2017)]|uniref:DUF6479 family protein n=1 Tax=Streptomyces sp. M41(2017) TaxID=1955065 RepID=UPI00117CD1F8|nr:DUF6479 family protein [Streptomyces sp. M41(2017)]
MIAETQTVLAFSSAGVLWVTVAGVFVVAILLAAFVLGSRRTAERRASAPTPPGPQVAEARRQMEDPRRSGADWSTPDDDPEQGRPHR